MNLSGNLLRVIVVLGVFIPAAAGAIAASGWLFATPPNPATSSREEIFRWLVQGDVAEQSPEMQIALVDRLEQELDLESAVLADELSASQKTNLAHNISTLKHVWFVDRVHRYSVIETEQRTDFMDECLQTVTTWSAAEVALNSESTSHSVCDFYDEIEQWIALEQDAQQQQNMRDCVNQGIFRWLSTYSLEELPFTARTDLAMRIAAEFEAGMSADGWELADAVEEQFRTNCELLMEAWIRHQATSYAALAESDRPAYISKQIDSVVQANVLALLSAGKDEQTALLQLLGLCEKWIGNAPTEEQPQIRQLLTAVQMELIRRKFQSNG